MVDAPANEPLFPLGQLLITANASQQLQETEVQAALRRHAGGDWGELDSEDWQENDHSVKSGYRILSSYVAQDQAKFWIITEADRSYTTVLLPEDY